ncbi:MAG: type II toxin-antitoxin system HicB family antitoxin [Deltaproteobacteria bacterium]|nr:type II toxin-antitoxin system HicB family antitoxin [Deltaproteobacteria bacterium]
MERHFTLEYWTDEGWYVGRLKEVPGVFSQGETLEGLEDNIKEAYHLMMTDEEALPPYEVRQKELEIEM